MRRKGLCSELTWGIITVILVVIPISYVQGTSPCTSPLPARGATDAGDQRAETPFTGSECGSGARAGSGFTMSCTACGATLLPWEAAPPTATLALRWSPMESLPILLNLPSHPWRPPA